MAASIHQSISTDVMMEVFPAKVSAIKNPITLKEFLRTFRHLIECAQSMVTIYYPLNFLFLVVLATLWNFYNSTEYHMPPIKPGNILPYQNGMTVLQDQVVKEAWPAAKKYFKIDQNINKVVFAKRFLALLSVDHQQG